MANNADNALIQGLYDVNNIQDRLRKYAQDGEVFKFWVIRQVTTLSLLKIISEKFGTVPTGQVSDWVFKYNEMDELPYQFHVSTATVGAMTELIFANNDSAVLKTSLRLHVDGIYCKATVANASTDMGTARTSTLYLPEELRIVSVGAEDSGGSGYRKVIVKRAYPADSYTNTAPAITTAMTLTVSNIVVRSNSKYQEIVNKNAKPLENVVQITRHSYGVGELMTKGGGIETFLSKGQEFLNTSYMHAEIFVTKTIERSLLLGRKSVKEINNDIELESGGILEFIQHDSEHWIDMQGKRPSVRVMNNLIRRVADTAGVQELWMFTGTQLSEQIADAYEDKRNIYTVNAELSIHYQVRVNTIESTGRATIVHHVTAPILNDIGMANDMLILNLTEYNWNEKQKFGCFQIAYKTGEGFEDLPKGSESYETNTGFQGVIRELYGTWGLVRRLPETHFYVYNWAQVSS